MNHWPETRFVDVNRQACESLGYTREELIGKSPFDISPDVTPAMVEELQGFVKRCLAPYKYPRAIEFRDALPRTETGKLQRFRLRAESPHAPADGQS